MSHNEKLCEIIMDYHQMILDDINRKIKLLILVNQE